MRAKSLDGFRKQLDKISNLSSCQVTQYVCADRREQGFTSPAMRWGQRQFKEELISHQTTSIQNPSPGQHRNLKRQTLSFYNSSVLCCFIFAQHLAHGFSTMGKLLCSHGKVTAHTRCAPPGDRVCIDGTESQVCWHWFWQAPENPSKPPNSFWEERSTGNFAHTYTGWATGSQTSSSTATTTQIAVQGSSIQ